MTAPLSFEATLRQWSGPMVRLCHVPSDGVVIRGKPIPRALGEIYLASYEAEYPQIESYLKEEADNGLDGQAVRAG